MSPISPYELILKLVLFCFHFSFVASNSGKILDDELTTFCALNWILYLYLENWVTSMKHKTTSNLNFRCCMQSIKTLFCYGLSNEHRAHYWNDCPNTYSLSLRSWWRPVYKLKWCLNLCQASGVCGPKLVHQGLILTPLQAKWGWRYQI